MFIIVHTDKCTEIARKIAAEFEDSRLVPVNSVLSDPESLGDFDSLGLVYEREGKDLPESVRFFIKTVLREYDLSGLQYMFSVCVCDGGPAHALKIVEKFCARVGCAPSLSTTIRPDASEQDISVLVGKIKSGEIQLAKGSLGTMWYMKAHGIKVK